MQGSAEKNEKQKGLFNRILLLNNISNAIANYGVKCGYEELFDQMDLSCGAVPDGSFEQVVDPEAATQFLSVYSKIVENRFAMAVTEVLKIDEKCFEPMKAFVAQVGRDNQVPGINSVQAAFGIYQAFILDGISGDNTKELLLEDENQIMWKKVQDVHEDAWKKAGGNLNNYYILLASFVNSLFEHAGIRFSIENNTIFRLEK